jgi:hypothetical protein
MHVAKTAISFLNLIITNSVNAYLTTGSMPIKHFVTFAELSSLSASLAHLMATAPPSVLSALRAIS